MAIYLDARVKLRIGTADAAGPRDALLIEGEADAPEGITHARFTLPNSSTLTQGTAHPSGCACCVPRGPVAEALSQLFLQRVRGEVAYFSEIVAVPGSPDGEAAIRAALQTDPVIAARFRLSE